MDGKSLVSSEEEENANKWWIGACIVSAATLPIVFSRIDHTLFFAGDASLWWAAILLPLLFALPFMILGALNKEYITSGLFGAAMLALGACCFLNAQQASFNAISENAGKTFDGALALKITSGAAV